LQHTEEQPDETTLHFSVLCLHVGTRGVIVICGRNHGQRKILISMHKFDRNSR